MSTIKENGQTYLESLAIDARAKQTAMSDYTRNNVYDESCDDARATGDNKGRGTGDLAGHGYSLPDMTKSPNEMNYKNFQTDATLTRIGNACDETARATMVARSLYGPNNPYGRDKIDTSANVADGQYDGATQNKIPFSCPIL